MVAVCPGLLRSGIALFFLISLASGSIVQEGAMLKEGIFTNGSLTAGYSLNETTIFTSSPSLRASSFTVNNNQNETLEIYVAFLNEGKWEVSHALGNVSPSSSRSLDCDLSFVYGGKRYEDSRMALLAETGSGKVVGVSFPVKEDWAAYEDEMKSSMGIVLYTVPLSGFFLLCLLGTMLFIAARSKHILTRGEDPGEYSFRSLFVPHVRGRPISELVADLLIHPLFWLFEIFTSFILVLLIFLSSFVGVPWEVGLMAFIVGGVACFIMPFTYNHFSMLMDLFEREPLRFPASMFLWGMFAAFLSFLFNMLAEFIAGTFFGVTLGNLGSGVTFLTTAILFAPIIEELFKGFGVLVASGHHEMNDTYDGIMYGFAAGLGFSAIENWFYFAANNNPVSAGGVGGWIFLMVYRGLFNSLAHGWFTATTGAFLGFFKARENLAKWAPVAFVPGAILAMTFHSIFNLFAVVDAIVAFYSNVYIFIFNPLMVVALSSLFLLVVIPYALWESRKRVHSASKSRCG